MQATNIAINYRISTARKQMSVVPAAKARYRAQKELQDKFICIFIAAGFIVSHLTFFYLQEGGVNEVDDRVCLL